MIDADEKLQLNYVLQILAVLLKNLLNFYFKLHFHAWINDGYKEGGELLAPSWWVAFRSEL